MQRQNVHYHQLCDCKTQMCSYWSINSHQQASGSNQAQASFVSLKQDTWQAMEKLVDDGLVKQIGISNFSCKKIDDLLSYARIKPAVLQVEVHPYFRNQQVVDHCKAKASFYNAPDCFYLNDE